ncbi:hypothetical protein ACMFMG_008581 [Clarireedia jacksonii]
MGSRVQKGPKVPRHYHHKYGEEKGEHKDTGEAAPDEKPSSRPRHTHKTESTTKKTRRNTSAELTSANELTKGSAIFWFRDFCFVYNGKANTALIESTKPVLLAYMEAHRNHRTGTMHHNLENSSYAPTIGIISTKGIHISPTYTNNQHNPHADPHPHITVAFCIDSDIRANIPFGMTAHVYVNERGKLSKKRKASWWSGQALRSVTRGWVLGNRELVERLIGEREGRLEEEGEGGKEGGIGEKKGKEKETDDAGEEKYLQGKKQQSSTSSAASSSTSSSGAGAEDEIKLSGTVFDAQGIHYQVWKKGEQRIYKAMGENGMYVDYTEYFLAQERRERERKEKEKEEVEAARKKEEENKRGREAERGRGRGHRGRNHHYQKRWCG